MIYPKKWVLLWGFNSLSEAHLRGGGAWVCAPYFCNHLLFCYQFKELETVLFEVKLIINKALLTYVYPNTIETCLTPAHLLFGRQLLYYSGTTSTDKINRISNHFWDRWRHE